MLRSRVTLVAFSVACLAPLAAADSVLYQLHGNSAGDQFGATVAAIGDVNQDGYPDFAVGAPEDVPAGVEVGSVAVLSGKDGSLLLQVTGDSEDDYCGSSIAGAGDVDRDGVPDFIAGAYQPDHNGYARVYSGHDGSVILELTGDAIGDAFGWQVASGDVNGDGVGDLIVGAPQSGIGPGYVRVHSGVDGSAIAQFVGETLLDYFGYAASVAGDVDGDGFLDVLAGAFGDDGAGLSAGRATVFSGRTGSRLFEWTGDHAGDRFGTSVALAGDADRDGVGDLVVGAFTAAHQGKFPGMTRVFSGSDGHVLHTFYGDDSGDMFGYAVSNAGDVNGDGASDLLVGAYQQFLGRPGYARVLSGSDGTVVATWTGDAPDDRCGASVAQLGDVDGDGYVELLVGIPFASDRGEFAGKVRVHSMGLGSIERYGSGCAGGGAFTPQLELFGSPNPGRTVSLEVSQALGGSVALIVFGLERAELPLPGGCLLLIDPILAFKLTLPLSPGGPGEGTASVAGTLPSDAAIGTQITMQAFIVDPGGTQGYSSSNGVELVIQ